MSKYVHWIFMFEEICLHTKFSITTIKLWKSILLERQTRPWTWRISSNFNVKMINALTKNVSFTIFEKSKKEILFES